MKRTKVISGFPGVGKSYMFNNKTDLIILDSGSSNFSWVKDLEGNNTRERNPEFPQNYINHIKENLGKVDIIFVSSHDVVRNALRESNISYILAYPNITLKDEYIKRYRDRGNDEPFISMINNKWDEFIMGIKKETFPTLIELYKDEYLSNIIKHGYCTPMSNEPGFVAEHLYNYLGCPITCTMCAYRKTI